MDVSGWNECLFEALVVANGRPGDPLYLYVDEEVLAQTGGFSTPEAALLDFKQAFRATSFKKSARAAQHWKLDGCLGAPPYFSALAMTVLAMTRPAEGRAEHNLYSRQRELLGETDLDGGAPEGYVEYVPILWKHWNNWLASQGAKYGSVTAREHSHYKYQGWARSQTIVRARDKEVIYAFFDAMNQRFLESASGEVLVDHLARWLTGSPKMAPLRRVALDPSYRDELAHCVEASLQFWKSGSNRGERVADRRTSVRSPKATNDALEASVYWESRSDQLGLIVENLSGKLDGEEIQDFALEKYTVEPNDPFVFLTPEDMPPKEWLQEDLQRWSLSKTIAVSWNRPAHGWLAFQEVRLGEWFETHEIEAARKYRVLVVAEQPSGLPAGYQLVEGPQQAARWVILDDSPLITGALLGSADTSVATAPVSAPLTLSLRGGLRLGRGNDFLIGGEPDVWMQGVSRIEEILAELDGQELDSAVFEQHEGALLLRLSSLGLAAGQHNLTVTDGESEKKVNLVSLGPEPSLGIQPGGEVAETEKSVVAPRVFHRLGSALLVFESEGTIWSAEEFPLTPTWVRDFDASVGENVDFERMIDLNGLGIPGGQNVIALRKSKTSKWQVKAFGGSVEALADELRIGLFPRRPSLDSVHDFLFGNGPVSIEDQGAKKAVASIRTTLGQTLLGRHKERTTAPLWEPKAIDGDAEPRNDIRTGAASKDANPFDTFLYWISENSGGVTTRAAEQAWEWMHASNAVAVAVSFKEALRSLEALGHIRFAPGRTRLHAEPTALQILPASEGRAVVTGARSRRLRESLRDENPRLSSEVEDAIQNLQHLEVVQVRNEVPISPTGIYVQLGADDISAQARALNTRLDLDSPLHQLNTLDSIKTTTFGEVNEVVGQRQMMLDVFKKGDKAPGGYWQVVAELPPTDGFLRAKTRSGVKYLWWDHTSQKLYECGWVKGLWLFHAHFTAIQLLGRRHSKGQFLVSDWAPLPSNFERALVSRSGLLPRKAEGNGQTWRVYENVPADVAVMIKELLGHGSAEFVRPTRLEYL